MNTKPISTGEQAASCYFRTSVEKPHRKALIQIDERCSLHCVHCFVSATRRGSSMPLGAVENVLALAEILREEAAVLDGLVDEVLGGRQDIELPRLRALPVALARLVVQRLADAAAGRPAPGTARRAEEVMQLRDGAALDLPHGIRAIVERGTLRFECHTTGGRKPPLKIKR